MPYGIIYKVTNLINNKIYIGQTVEELKERQRKHFYSCDNNKDANTVFYNSIRKYGKENFKWEIIDTGDSKLELDEKETYWINETNSHISNGQGYNMTSGGDGCDGFKHSQESIKKMSDFRKELYKNKENCPMYGKNHSNEAKEKISTARKEKYTGENHPWYGKSHSEEAKKKMSESSKGVCAGKDNYQAKAIIQLSLDNEFIARHDTIRDGAKFVNGQHSAVSKCCSGQRKKHKGFKWMYEKDYLELKE
ncbi:homing endonuclease [Bacillus phage Izhevsk]|uniref:GIY-YIG endonuclease n=1 Tax=Bacillus phage Izhevsk TaxID=2724322 RepID=A0A6H0X621_9CAUD|nr:homing endonuclease [Bacillus phage Izhevsk]QIW89770.1 GIY-YIG endonuclease [Bacillus phage Izhevsk]